jgi:hypothetical protein
MSDFYDLTVVFQSPKTEKMTFPVHLSRIKQVWYKAIRKAVPTYTQEIPYFHTLILSLDQDPHNAETAMWALANAEYTIVSVVATDLYGSDELTEEWRADVADVSALFHAIHKDTPRYEAYIAYVKEYDFDPSMGENSWGDNHIEGAYDSLEDFAMEYTFDTAESVKRYKGAYGSYTTEEVSVMQALPDYVSIDWEDTANNLADDFLFAGHNGSTHVFRSNV